MFKHSINLNNKTLFQKYTQSYPYGASGLSFASLFMWKNLNEFKYEIINDFLCISAINHLNKDYKELFVLPPLAIGTYNVSKLCKTLQEIKERFEFLNQPFNMKLLPQSLLPTFRECSKDLLFTPDRDNFDYVYASKDLIHLSGRKYHSKKNHLNYFFKNTPYTYMRLTDEHIKGCIDLTTRLIYSKDYDELQNHLIHLEQTAIKEALIHMKDLDLVGGVLLIHNKVEAFTLGTLLNPETMVVHIEKANTEYKGIYQAINQQFCQHECVHIPYINREEDMGIPNLRKAKESYRPIHMVEKYNVQFKEQIYDCKSS